MFHSDLLLDCFKVPRAPCSLCLLSAPTEAFISLSVSFPLSSICCLTFCYFQSSAVRSMFISPSHLSLSCHSSRFFLCEALCLPDSTVLLIKPWFCSTFIYFYLLKFQLISFLFETFSQCTWQVTKLTSYYCILLLYYYITVLSSLTKSFVFFGISVVNLCLP